MIVKPQRSDPNYDIKQLALECATKRIYPIFLTTKKSSSKEVHFKTPVGCRSFLNTYEEDGQLIHDGGNNLGVVSLNLPRVPMKLDPSSSFYEILKTKLHLAKRALDTRIHRLENVKAGTRSSIWKERVVSD